MHRGPAALAPGSAALEYHYIRPGLNDIDVGFAGRQHMHRPVHRAIAALSPGDRLETHVAEGGRWQLLDRSGRAVGRLAASFRPPPGMRCRSAEVLAVVGRSREASEPQYRDSARCDSWEVVVPELVFEPDQQEGRKHEV